MIHKNDFSIFGTRESFEIAARWTKDSEPRSRLPQREGWSAGDLRIIAGGQILTANTFNGKAKNHLSWYLAPVVEWLITNWTYLFHEERYNWPDKTGNPAAVATLSAMERTIGSDDEEGQKEYSNIQEWWRRHAFRASDSSAIYPDIVFRRIDDDIEISWHSRQPAYAPEGFALKLLPGYIRLPVASVAEPLWKFLKWATCSPEVEDQSDKEIISDFQSRLAQIKEVPLSSLELIYINNEVRRVYEKACTAVNWESDSRLLDTAPVITALDSSVLMFGGLNVQIGEKDAIELMKVLSSKRGGEEHPALTRLVMNPNVNAWTLPYDEGYELAYDLRDDLGIEADEIFVDIHGILKVLNIEITELKFETDSIRGIAIAGDGYSPAIIVNTNSFYNRNEAGKRFTLAHELCHILYDRTRARKISHVSGQWAPARTEKRANAFAVMFLASTTALRKSFTSAKDDDIHALAEQVSLGTSALIEHLFNINLIGDTERELLRQRCH